MIENCIVRSQIQIYMLRAGFSGHINTIAIIFHHYILSLTLSPWIETQRPALHALLQPLTRLKGPVLMIDLSAKAPRRSVVYLQAPEIMNLMSQQGSGGQISTPASPSAGNNRPRIYETPSPLTLRMQQYYRRMSNNGASKTVVEPE
jgi:hypothetical protein